MGAAPGVSVFLCGRKRAGAECSNTGCSDPSIAKCKHELRGRKAGVACGREVCARHQGDPKNPTCPPHQRNPTGR